MMKAEKILLIDDDKNFTDVVSLYLKENNFDVIVEHSGAHAHARIIEESPDLVLLDIMLPEIDGLTICKQVRDKYYGPIIMLTALGDEVDEIVGLEVGADDYLCKPVKPRFLLAHIRAQLRRNVIIEKKQARKTLKFLSGCFEIDLNERIVKQGNCSIILTSAEYELLLLLANNLGNPLSRDELFEKIYGFEYDGIDRSIDLRICRLRKKLGDVSKESQIIKTIRNQGYMLVP